MRLLARGVLIAGLLAMFIPLLLSGHLLAQNLTGEIDGIVRDSTGAVIPNAAVTVTNASQNLVVRTLQTNEQGQFVAPALATGEYLVTVKATGFQTATVRQVEVNVNEHTPIQVALPLGNVSQTVLVTTASSVTPDTQSAAAGTLLSGAQVRQLSLSSRNFQQLLALQPGVSGNIPGTVDRGIVTPSGGSSTNALQVSGQRPSQNGFFLDGADILNHGGSKQVSIFPSIDAIQEVGLLRNGYGAQYGGEGSAIVSMQTRSGATAFHGGAFEFFRSQVLDANDYFNNLAGIPRPGLRYSDYGYHLGGPVWIPHIMDRRNPKTFFFFLQEFLREASPSNETLTNIATAAQRQGTFSAPVCIAYNSGGKCTNSTTSITQIDPTAQAYLTDIINKTPLPNSPSDPQGLIASETGFNNGTQTVIRIDHQFNQKLNVFFRYIDDPYHVVAPNGYGGGTAVPGVSPADITDGGTSYMGHATFTMDPNTVFDGGYAYSDSWIVAQPTGLTTYANAPDIRPTLPYLSNLPLVPGLSINGLSYGSGFYNNPGKYNQIFLNVTHIAGRHTFYFGGAFETETAGNEGTNTGNFTFSPTPVPAGSKATQFMQSFANFLQGKVSSFSQPNVGASVLAHHDLYEAYFQDDFHATRRLTLNGGVRYTFMEQPRTEPFAGQKNIPLTNFDPNLYDPAKAPTIGTGGLMCLTAPCPGGATPNSGYNPLNGIIVSGSTSPYGSAISSQPNLNFAPRVGFAWDVRGDGRTSLRGGYGIYYIQTQSASIVNMDQINPPYVTTTVIPNAPFGDPGSGIPAGNASPLVVKAQGTDWSTPYSQDWSLDFQQQIANNMVFDLGYYGDRGTYLIGTLDLNQPAAGEYVQKQIIPGNQITNGNTVLLNQIRPFLGYGKLLGIEPIFSSNYNSLQTALKKQFSDGSIVDVNYTWSKALTDNVQDTALAPQDTADIPAEYGPTSFNRTQVLTAHFVYHLPFFRGQSGIVHYVLGGWEPTGIISYASGKPVNPSIGGVDPGGLGLLGSAEANRPDAVLDPNNSAPHKLTDWFNTAAFIPVPAGQYRPGNARPGSIVGPGYEHWDLSLFKNFPLPREAVMQFRFESFNAFNHTNFDGVAANVKNSNYGQVTSAGEARVIQLAAKINF